MENEKPALPAYVRTMKKGMVLVVGDIMMDRFVYGAVERISPESPVPVLSSRKETVMLGGSGNVLANLADLGVKAVGIAVVGDDGPAQTIRDLAASKQIDIRDIVTDPARDTTIKTRFLAQNQQLLRVDSETPHALSPETENGIMAAIKERMADVQAVILSDYGKGVLSDSVIRCVIEEARRRGLPVLVDPKGTDYSRYRGAAVVTPNRKELSEATGGLPTKSDEEIAAAGRKMLADSGIAALVATRSEDGMTVIDSENGGRVTHLPTQALEVYDVSGAGDTVIATVAAALAAGASLTDAARIANKAGGLVVAKIGTATVRNEELAGALEYADQDVALLDANRRAPLYGWDEAREQVQRWQAQGLSVGFTNGHFDIIHFGHVSYLNQARDRCDRLVLGLNSDASTTRRKGPERPINDEQARAAVAGALGSVDMVVLFADDPAEEDLPSAVIGALRPDVIFKGGDYTIDQLPEAQVVLSYGGRVEIMPVYEGHSTTNIVEKTRQEKRA